MELEPFAIWTQQLKALAVPVRAYKLWRVIEIHSGNSAAALNDPATDTKPDQASPVIDKKPPCKSVGITVVLA